MPVSGKIALAPPTCWTLQYNQKCIKSVWMNVCDHCERDPLFIHNKHSQQIFSLGMKTTKRERMHWETDRLLCFHILGCLVKNIKPGLVCTGAKLDFPVSYPKQSLHLFQGSFIVKECAFEISQVPKAPINSSALCRVASTLRFTRQQPLISSHTETHTTQSTAERTGASK